MRPPTPPRPRLSGSHADFGTATQPIFAPAYSTVRSRQRDWGWFRTPRCGLLAAWPGSLEEFAEEEDWIREFTSSVRLTVARHFDFASLLVSTDPESIRVSPAGAAFLRSIEGRNLVSSRLQMEIIAVREGETLPGVLDELLVELGVQLGG